MYYAKKRIITPEMEYVAIRENQQIEALGTEVLYHAGVRPQGNRRRSRDHPGEYQSPGSRADDYR